MEWNLRMAAAQRGIWRSSDLRRLLALAGLDLSSGKTPDPETLQKLTEAAQTLDNTKLTAASAEIEAWAKENCSTGG